MRFSLLALAGFLTAAITAPTPQERYAVHERRDRLPMQWEKTARIHEASVIPMRVALTQKNLHKGEDFLMDVSHPDSPSFGKQYVNPAMTMIYL